MAFYEDKQTYRCRVAVQRFAEIGNNKTQAFVLDVEPIGIIDTDGNVLSCQKSNYTQELKFWLTKKAAERSIERLEKLGWPGTSFKTLDPTLEGHHSFVGLEIDLVNSHNHNGGKVYDEFDFKFEGNSERPESTTDAGRKFDALFGDKLKNKGKAAPAQQPGAFPPAGAAPLDDEVPF